MHATNKPFVQILGILSIVIILVTPAQSQITFQVGAGAGLAMPASDYSGTTVDFYNGSKYGLKSGFTLNAKVRAGVLGFRGAGEVNYSSFSNTGEALPGQGSVDISQKVLSLKVGPELSLGLPLMPIAPYFGANIALNRFSGTVKFQGVSKVPSASYDLKSATRIGFGFTGGVVLKLGGFTTLDVSAAYDLMNASGKTWEDDNLNLDQRIDSYLTLNDDKDPLYKSGDDKHFISNSRSINAIQIRATLMIGL
jgi:hypothetical protein